MLNEGQISQAGVIESVKNAMQPETIASKLGIDKNMLIDIGLYGAIGFIIGFLLKKYSEYFIACVLLVIAIVVLQQFEYVSISLNTSKIHEMLGLPSIPLVADGYGTLLLQSMKSNVAGTASFVTCFLIGLKVG